MLRAIEQASESAARFMRLRAEHAPAPPPHKPMPRLPTDRFRFWRGALPVLGANLAAAGVLAALRWPAFRRVQ